MAMSACVTAADKRAETVQFLESIGLPQEWSTKLIVNGFDEMDTLVDIEDFDMKELGIPRGYTIKVLKAVRAFRVSSSARNATDHAAHCPQAPTLLEHRSLSNTIDGKLQVIGGNVGGELQISCSVRDALQQSWVQVQQVGVDYVGEIFSEKLFELSPNTHARAGMEWGPVVKGIGHTVDNLKSLETVAARYRRLGVLHRCIGVKDHELREMGDAFVLALRQVLGKSFTRDAEAGWRAVYGFVSHAMMEDVRQ